MTARKSSSYKSSKKTKKTGAKKWFFFVFIIATLYVVFFYTNDYIINRSQYALENTQLNYGKEVDVLSEKLNLPQDYIKALIMLECSGRKPANPRFEEHVYEKLKQVKMGQRIQYENITTAMLRHTSDNMLRQLATSWGPFQIMGYKSIQLKIKLHNLHGNNALYWGMKWISDDYGFLLRRGRYKDAFHFHNTGREFPANGESLTHDPKYVVHGLKYMKFFEESRKQTKE